MKIKISNGKLIDGTGAEPTRPAEIIVDNGKILEINQIVSPSDDASFDKVIDAGGRTICPGLINAHLHLYMDAGSAPLHDLAVEDGHLSLLKATVRCRQLLMAGITAVRDMGAKDLGILALKQAMKEGLVEGPRIVVCGKALAITGGHAPVLAIAVDGSGEIRRKVRELLGCGVDFIKLFATGGFGKPGEQLHNFEFTVEELGCAVQTAHAAGKPVAAHAYWTQGIRNAVEAGVDSIEHAAFLDEDVLAKIVKNGIFLVPTLTNTFKVSTAGTHEGLPGFMVETAKRAFPEMMEQFSNAYRAGAKLAVGTDGGSWLNQHGDVHTELKLRAQAGVSNMDLIKMATQTSAQCLGIDHETGTIEVGKRSDIIIVDGDPLENIDTLKKVSWVIKGNRTYPVSGKRQQLEGN